MTKKELIESIKNYPDDIEIVIWGVLCGHCSVTDIVEINIEDKKGETKHAIKLS